jgi:hypothetical protein
MNTSTIDVPRRAEAAGLAELSPPRLLHADHAEPRRGGTKTALSVPRTYRSSRFVAGAVTAGLEDVPPPRLAVLDHADVSHHLR